MILDIPPHIEQMITDDATAQGISPDEWAKSILLNYYKPSGLYDWLKNYPDPTIGDIDLPLSKDYPHNPNRDVVFD